MPPGAALGSGKAKTFRHVGKRSVEGFVWSASSFLPGSLVFMLRQRGRRQGPPPIAVYFLRYARHDYFNGAI